MSWEYEVEEGCEREHCSEWMTLVALKGGTLNEAETLKRGKVDPVWRCLLAISSNRSNSSVGESVLISGNTHT